MACGCAFAATVKPTSPFAIRSSHHHRQRRAPADPNRALTDLAVAGNGLPLRKRDFVFVVNPISANGATGREWKKLLPQLHARLGKLCNIYESLTSGPMHAVDITRQAIKDGAGAVIAVGGDGTLHEVVNGFFEAGRPVSGHGQGVEHSTTLGLIPLGTGSDFARTFGWKKDPYEAIDRIAKGEKCKVDVGVVNGEDGEPHYFINVADVHLSSKAGYFASKYKWFGNWCYVIGALTAFMQHHDWDFKIKVNDGDQKVFKNVMAICIGNAKYYGGGMKITPTADPCSGSLEVVIVQNLKWFDFLLNLHKLYQGRHLSLEKIISMSVDSIEVEEVVKTGKIYVQCDGEFLGFLPRRFSIIPGTIDMFI